MNPKTSLKVMALAAAAVFFAGAQAQERSFDIAGGELKGALDAYAAQSGTQLIYKIDDVKGRSTKGIKRALSSEEALRQLLEGTPLAVRRDVSGALVIFMETPQPPPPKPDKRADSEPAAMDTVVVSATRRREPAREVPMQVSSLLTEKLNRSGAKTLQDYLGNEAGVDVKSTGGPGIGTLTIRGVSTGTQTISTVAVYIDDVAFGSSTATANGAQMALDMALAPYRVPCGPRSSSMWLRSSKAMSSAICAPLATAVLEPKATSSMYTPTVAMVWVPVLTPRMASVPIPGPPVLLTSTPASLPR